MANGYSANVGSEYHPIFTAEVDDEGNLLDSEEAKKKRDRGVSMPVDPTQHPVDPYTPTQADVPPETFPVDPYRPEPQTDATGGNTTSAWLSQAQARPAATETYILPQQMQQDQAIWNMLQRMRALGGRY
jgi:hypothetical protein